MGNRIRTKNKEQWTKFSLILCSLSFVLCSGGSASASERIVSLNACTDELLLQLAEPHQIAGVTRFDHSPLNESVLAKNSNIVRIPEDAESILRLNPSIAIASAYTNPQLLEQLRKRRIKVVTFEVPKNWDELMQTAEAISKMTGQSKMYGELVRSIFDLKNARVQSRWLGKRALFWSAGGYVPGKNIFENTIIDALGMFNATAYEGFNFLSIEQVIALKPDVLIISQNSNKKDSWSHDTVFHPAIKTALPHLEYLFIPDEAVSCASGYSVQALWEILYGVKDQPSTMLTASDSGLKQ